MTRTIGRAVLLALTLAPAAAQAQQAPLVTLAPENPARWEAAGFAGWAAAQSGPATWEDWSDAASFGAATGYYWTPHIKFEGDVAATTWGRVFVQEPLGQPGRPVSSFVFGEQRFRSLRGSGAAVYQFLQNTWLHPFAGVGVEVSREWSRRDLQEQAICESPCPPVQRTREATERTRARPIAVAGFKWYVAERAFLRSEIRASFSARRTESVQWRVGVGVDF